MTILQEQLHPILIPPPHLLNFDHQLESRPPSLPPMRQIMHQLKAPQYHQQCTKCYPSCRHKQISHSCTNSKHHYKPKQLSHRYTSIIITIVIKVEKVKWRRSNTLASSNSLLSSLRIKMEPVLVVSTSALRQTHKHVPGCDTQRHVSNYAFQHAH